MYRQDFYYDLPQNLIAQHPANPRSSSRLLAYNSNKGEVVHHESVLGILDYLGPNDLLISNNTKVLPARFFAKKETGGQVEILFERLLAENRMICHIRASKSPKIGSAIIVNSQWELTVLGRLEDLFEVEVNGLVVDLLYACGHMPLPPYIARPDEDSDKENYQTIFAKHEGSVAAPTAGLHFDDLLMNKLAEKKVPMMSITLHVGAGTFKPVRADLIKDHIMHYEWYEVSKEVVEKIQEVKAAGGRVIAIGTTSLRALESAAKDNFKTLSGLTNLFITPGYQFKVIDGLMTNFHLPESTLLMLVAALIGHEKLMHIYQEAVRLEYRFFSYGDACLFL